MTHFIELGSTRLALRLFQSGKNKHADDKRGPFPHTSRCHTLMMVQLNALQLLHRKSPLLPTLPLKNIWIHMCVTVVPDARPSPGRNALLGEECRRAYLVHIVAVEAVAGVAVRTRSTLHTRGRLNAHVPTETDARHAPRLHHLGTTQTFFRRQTDGCLTARLSPAAAALASEGGCEPTVPQAWHSEMVFLRNDVSLT